MLRQACDERLRPIGLSMSQYAVLRALADHPKASSAERARPQAAERAITEVEGRMIAGLSPADERRLGALLGACATNLAG